MIDGGLILILLASFLAFAGPTEKLIVQRRNYRAVVVMARLPLSAAFPVPAQNSKLALLADEAGAALNHDDLLRGIRAITDIYDLPQR